MSPDRGAKPSPSLAAARTSSLNSRRIVARLLDGLILIGAPVLMTHVFRGIDWFVASLWVTVAYFFLLESIFGQTIGKNALGLRVVRRDGGPPSASAVATRNVIRIFEEPVLALLVLFGSRRRRQRLGDLAAGTTVGLERASVRPYPSPLVVLYPLLWAALGVAMVASAGPPDRPPSFRSSDSPALVKARVGDSAAYLEELQALCRARDLEIRKHWVAPSGFILRQELAFTRQVAAVPAPDSMLYQRRSILIERRKLDRLTRAMHRGMTRSADPQRLFADAFRPKLQAAANASSRAFAEAGLICSTGKGPLP
jgi:uncharacterized RDD family membrane protein YckC